MRPLMTESPCLKCHAAQGYRVGDVRGGISIQVPFEPYARSAGNQRKPLLFGHLLIGLLGLAGLGALQHHMVTSAKMLKESETKYRDIFSNIQDVYYRTDERGNFVELSPSVLKYSGYSRDELIGKPAASFYSDPHDRAQVLDAMGKNGEVVDYEIEMQRKDGRLVHASLNSHFLYNIAGELTGVEGVLRDITERKKIENELKRAKAEWERTFDAIADPVMILDTNYGIVKANKAMAAALDVTPAEAVGMTCYRSVHGTEAPPEFCPHAALLKDGQAHSQEIYEPRLGGHYHISVSPFHAPDGALIGSIHAARDITALKKVEELSQQYSHDLEQLLAISREITATTDLKNLYSSFVSTARDILKLDFSTLLLLSEDKKTLTMQDCLGFPESMIGHFSVVEGQGLATLVVMSKKPETVEDFTRETRFEVPPVVREKSILSAVAVPMMMKDEIIGVLVGHTLDRRAFSLKDISLYQQIGNQAAVAIQNAMNTDLLRTSEKKIRDIASSLGEGLYVLNDQGNVTFMNPEAERLLGWTEDELRGKNIHDIVHNRRPDGMYLSFEACPMHKVIDSGERFISRDEVFIRKDGVVFPVSVISAPLMEEGKLKASITAFRDISERKLVEQEREKLIADLQKALAEIKTLHGILPICSFCKKIRDNKGAWHQLEAYISEHTESEFSHGLCQECAKKMYPEYYQGDKE